MSDPQPTLEKTIQTDEDKIAQLEDKVREQADEIEKQKGDTATPLRVTLPPSWGFMAERVARDVTPETFSTQETHWVESTEGPELTIRVGPSALLYVHFGAALRSETNGSGANMGVRISRGGVTIAETDDDNVLRNDNVQWIQGMAFAVFTRADGLINAFHTVEAVYKTYNGARRAFFAQRKLIAIGPLDPILLAAAGETELISSGQTATVDPLEV